MTRRVRRAGRPVLAAAAVLLLAACSAGTSGAGVPVATTAPATPSAGTPSPASSALVAAAALEPCPAAGGAPVPAAGARTLPATTLPCLGAGPAVALAGLAGRPAVVNVWASWCTPCRAELPLLGHLAAGTPSVRVLGVDALDDPSSALSLLAQAGAHYPSVRDDTGATKAALQWGSGLPVTLFVAADGSVAYQLHGQLGSQEQLDALVREHLGVTPGA